MKIDELNTYNELKEYLLERMDYADNKISKMNPSFTREKIWNMYMGDCIKWSNENLPKRTKELLIKNIKKDFNQII